MTVSAKSSLRYKLILGGAVREYPDGRQVCCDTPKGKAIYQSRIEHMRLRQHNICARGNHPIVDPTFDHERSRGGHGGFRDDRVENEAGKWMNGCSCCLCNGLAGSRPFENKVNKVLDLGH
jgi:hypothetical protein